MSKSNTLIRAALSVAAVFSCGLAFAEPVCASRYIKLVIPQPAGGVGDVVGRLLADKVSAILEQTIVVENKGGASTTIGTAAVAAAKPDGCTLLHMTTTAVVASAINNKLPYDLERDLIPVVGVGSFPLALTVTEGSKWRSLADITAAAKSGDNVAYSTGGTGSMAHLASLRLLTEAGGKGTHVPYRGNAPALAGLLGNEVNFMFPTTFEAIPLEQGKKVRVLGVTSEQRLAAFPNTPTMKELGYPEFSRGVWYAFLLPTGTRPAVVARVQDAFAKAVMDPAVHAQLSSRGFIPGVLGTAEMTAFLKAELVRYKKLTQENNITSFE